MCLTVAGAAPPCFRWMPCAACAATCEQPSFELGVLAYEVCTGEHPVPDYSVDLDYAAEDLPGTVCPRASTRQGKAV